jgi:uncharacterized protein (TIGR00106 family)
MLVFLTIAPTDTGEESLSEAVAGVLDLIDRSGLPYRTGPMGTTIEGDWDEVMALVKRCHLHMRERSGRVGTLIKIDDREGATGRLDGKTASLEARLGRKLKR